MPGWFFLNTNRLLPSIRAVVPALTRPLRRAVLRPGQSDEELEVPFEEHPGSRWFVAEVEGVIAGCAGVLPEPRPDGPTHGWRVRAMATEPAVRGHGIGTLLLGACARYVVEQDGVEVWCTARTHASGFYLARGFESVGEPFDLHGLGLHVVMTVDPGRLVDQTD